MSRPAAEIPKGTRTNDCLNLGVLTSNGPPLLQVKAILPSPDRASQRQRELSAQMAVCYTMALALAIQAYYRKVLRYLLKGLV